MHILGSQSVYGRAEGIADNYWPWAVFLKMLKFRQGSGPKGDLQETDQTDVRSDVRSFVRTDGKFTPLF